MSDANKQSAERYRISDLVLEVDSARLLRDGREIPLPKLSFDLLTALARRSPAVATFDNLMDDVWGDVVVGPETVTQRVKLVRDALGDDSGNPRYIAPVRGRGYRLIPAVEAFGGLSEVATRSAHRRLRYAAFSVILVMAAVSVWRVAEYRTVERAVNVDPRAIAVLPFTNMSNEPDNDALAAGIHDDVLTKISQIAALQVISRTSVELLGHDQSIPEIAQSLGVATVLEGSVQRFDDSIRINVQLIDGQSDHHIWSKTYDRQLSVASVFAIQSEIASAIADSLEATLSEHEVDRLTSPSTDKLAAYEAYLLGRRSMLNRNTAELQRAQAHFQQAIDIDPDYAQAYLGLAQSLRLSAGYGTLSRAEAAGQYEGLIEQALALDSDLGEAYAERGRLRAGRNEFELAERDFVTALRLSPNNSVAYAGYAAMLSRRNRNEEALENYIIARKLDPLSGAINADLGLALLNTGRYDDALEQYHHTIAVAPKYAGGYRGVAEISWTVFGRLDEAYAWRQKILDLDPGDPVNPAVIGLICLDLGDPTAAAFWIDKSLALGAERRRPYWAKEALHLYLGDTETSLNYAERVRNIDPSFRFTVTHLRNEDVRAGRLSEALTRYRSLFPDFLDGNDPEIEFWNYIAAIDIAYLLQQTGEDERADMLLRKSVRALDDIRRLGPRGYAIGDVEIYALQGKRELALATLREAVDSGWRMQWWFWLDHSPNLNSLRNTEEFKAIRQTIADDMATQLMRVKGLEPARQTPGSRP